jgi:hypothetical protein
MIPDLTAIFAASFSPEELPARGSAPIRLSLLERVVFQTGVNPVLRELEVELDRHLGLSVKGLPSCPKPSGDYGPRSDVLVKCEDAKVGSGTVDVMATFPEQQPVVVTGRVSVYNGGVRDGHTMLWIYSLVPAPVTGAILIPLDVRRDSEGFYGWNGLLSLPEIAGGYGAVTKLQIAFRKGIFLARCQTGRLRARGVSRFADGSVWTNSAPQTCSRQDPVG